MFSEHWKMGYYMVFMDERQASCFEWLSSITAHTVCNQFSSQNGHVAARELWILYKLHVQDSLYKSST